MALILRACLFQPLLKSGSRITYAFRKDLKKASYKSQGSIEKQRIKRALQNCLMQTLVQWIALHRNCYEKILIV